MAVADAVAGEARPLDEIEGNFRALLIVAGDYTKLGRGFRDLPSASTDLDAMSAVLQSPRIGLFSDCVTPVANPDHTTLVDAVERFFTEAEPDDRLLVYFSGHGHQDRSNRLNLCPCDADTDRPLATMLRATEILRAFEESEARSLVLVLDCCYSANIDVENGPFGRPVIAANVAVLVASSVGQEIRAATDERGRSAFTGALCDALADGKVPSSHTSGLVSASAALSAAKARLPNGSAKPQLLVLGADDAYISRSFDFPPPQPSWFNRLLAYRPLLDAHHALARAIRIGGEPDLVAARRSRLYACPICRSLDLPRDESEAIELLERCISTALVGQLPAGDQELSADLIIKVSAYERYVKGESWESIHERLEDRAAVIAGSDVRLAELRSWLEIESVTGRPPPANWQLSALQDIVYALDNAFRPIALDFPPLDADDEEQLRSLLPKGAAQSEIDRIHAVGFGLTELERRSMRLLPSVVEDNKSMLLLGTTGSGKSTVGRYAAMHAIARGRRAVIALPLKALVTQELDAWTDWLRGLDLRIRVVPCSRDFPESDRDVARGNYDVALVIYEKLAAFLAHGAPYDPLNNVGVVVIDEIQYLREGERGEKLESLIAMIRQDRPDVPIIGISAAISQTSASRLSRWLGVEARYRVESRLRPVPLDVIVATTQESRRQRHAHLLFDHLNSQGAEVPEPEPADTTALIDASLERLKAMQPQIYRALEESAIRRALVLAWNLLAEDPDTRIIVFVSSRHMAEQGAELMRRLLKDDRRFRRAGRRRANPWISGRFASAQREQQGQARRTWERLQALTTPSERNFTVMGLRSGVAFHTGRVSAAMRRLTESEFRKPDGLLRVILATDTLAYGINLPADIVILSSLEGYSGRGYLRTLAVGDVRNKGGRAGRLGLSRHQGELYIVLGETTAGDGGEAELPDFDRTFTRYARQPDTESVLHPSTTVGHLSRLVLQQFVRHPQVNSWEELRDRAEHVLRYSFAAVVASDAIPTPDEVLKWLASLQLIGEVEGGCWCASGLGRSVAKSGLPLEAADTLKDVALAAEGGAGPLSLLWLAARSAVIDDQIAWVRLRRKADEHVPSMLQRLFEYLHPYVTKSTDERNDRARVLTHEHGTAPIPPALLSTDLVGDCDAFDNAVALAQDHIYEDLEEAARLGDGLLRAVVLLEWQAGVPFDEMTMRLKKVITSDRRRAGQLGSQVPPSIDLHLADLEQLASQVSTVLTAAAEVTRPSPSRNVHTELRNLALAVDRGMPAWLVPLRDLRVEGLHREFLCTLRAKEPPEDSYIDLFADDELALPNDVLEDAVDAIRARERDQRNAPGPGGGRSYSSTFLPDGSGVSFQEVLEQCEEARTDSMALDAIEQLISSFGLGFETVNPTTGLITHNGAAISVRVRNEITRSVARTIAGSKAQGLTIVHGRIAPTARALLRAELAPGMLVLEIDLLVNLFLNILQGWAGAGELAAAAFGALQRGAGLEEGLDVMNTDGFGARAAPPPFTGRVRRIDEVPQ